MKSSENDVLKALESVVDPLLLQPITELGTVRSLSVADNRVEIIAGVPVPRQSLIRELDRRIREALTSASIANGSVSIALLTEDEMHGLREKLRPHKHLAEGEKAPNPFDDEYANTRVLGITSGKGGVGKSSVTVNLALALHKLGKRVAIIDADVYGFSIPKMLGIEDDPVVVIDLIVPPVGYEIPCISIGFFVEEETPVMWRGPMLHKALEQFLVDVYWSNPDYVLIDMPPGTGDVAMSMAQYLPRSETFVVTTPQDAAQRVAQRSALMAKKINLPLVGVIENMSWFTGDDGKRYELFGTGGGEALAEKLEVPLLGQIPLVPALREGGDIGKPIVIAEPDSEAAQAFVNIAEQVENSGPRRVYKSELKLVTN